MGSERIGDSFDPTVRGDQNTVRYTVGPRGFMGPSAVGISRPKPLHWARIRLVAVLIGAVAGGILAAFVDARAVVLGVPLGAVAALLVVTALERLGVFRRTDEL
jgi:hypothetical protein